MVRDVTHELPALRWPFTGREEALAAGRLAIEHERGAIVLGPSGVGKTRLARALTVDGGPDWHVVAGSRGADGVPLGAWAHLLPDDATSASLDASSWRAVADHLRGEDGAIRLVVDDAHWLDLTSAALLHHLVATGQAVAVVTARRDPRMAPPITALWKDEHLVRIDLDRMGVDEVAAVVEAALGAPVEPTTTERLHHRTGGDLVLVRELVEEARRSGALQLIHGAWIEVVETRPGPRLVDLLVDRIGELSPGHRDGVEVLAVAPALDRRVVGRIVPAPVIDGLVADGLAEIAPGAGRPTISLADPILAAVLVERVDAPRREGILRRVVDQLAASGELTDDDLLRLVSWQVELRDPIDPDAALRAADLAIGRGEVAIAIRLADAADRAGAGPAAAIRRGQALVHAERDVEADEALRPIGEQLAEIDDELRYRYANARALALGRNLGRIDEAIAVLEATIATMADDRSRWALEAQLAFLLADCGRLAAARPLAEARLANVADDEPSALTAFVACALIRTYAGRCQDTLELCDAMMPVAMRHLDERPEAVAWIVAAQMLATYVQGDFPASLGLIDAMLSLLAEEGDPTVRAGLLMSEGLIRSEQGQLDRALRLLRQAAALHELDNRRGYQAWCFAITSRVHAMRGDLDAARVALAAAREHLWPGGQSFAGDLDVAALWIEVLAGDRAAAQRILDDGLRWCDREGMTVRSLRLRHEAIRAGMPVLPHVEAFGAPGIGDQSPWARAGDLRRRAGCR